MLSHGTFFGKYGTQTTFYLALEDVTNTDAPFVGVAPVAADIFLSKDGGAPAAATNGMTAVGNGIYSWVATAAEMQATRLAVSVYDQTATEIFKPIYFVVQTKLQLGQLDVDATQIGGNTVAILAQGVGTGAGLQATGGATGHGIRGLGGATSGHGIDALGVATGNGLHAVGGATSASGIYGAGSGADGTGIEGVGAGTGHGFEGTGGATSGHGIAAVGGAPNGEGIFAQGTGAGEGIQATGGATGNGIQVNGGSTSGHGIVSTAGPVGDGFRSMGGSTSGEGINAQAQASGDGFHGVGAGGGSAANFGGGGVGMSWDDLEGTEPAGAPPANASFRQILQYLKRCELNYASETAGTRKVYKDDSSTELYTQTITNDNTTRTRGKAQ